MSGAPQGPQEPAGVGVKVGAVALGLVTAFFLFRILVEAQILLSALSAPELAGRMMMVALPSLCCQGVGAAVLGVGCALLVRRWRR